MINPALTLWLYLTPVIIGKKVKGNINAVANGFETLLGISFFDIISIDLIINWWKWSRSGLLVGFPIKILRNIEKRVSITGQKTKAKSDHADNSGFRDNNIINCHANIKPIL